MPIYEYYCGHCHGVFEQLLPVARASEDQPCPDCDNASKRLMPTTVSSVIVRDGIPRRIPDTGKYWHHEQIVDRPVNTTVELGEHPDLYTQKYGPERPPSVEEDEAFADEMIRRIQHDDEIAEDPNRIRAIDQTVQHRAADYLARKQRTAAEAKAARRRNPNSRVTPRTASGEHVSSKRQPKKGGGSD